MEGRGPKVLKKGRPNSNIYIYIYITNNFFSLFLFGLGGTQAPLGSSLPTREIDPYENHLMKIIDNKFTFDSHLTMPLK